MSGLKFWILSIFTLGIYGLAMWCRMTNNLNAMATKVGEKNIRGFIGAILLGFITFGIVPFVWTCKFYGLAARLNRKASAGVSPSGGFWMFIVSCIPIVSFFWMAKMNNKLIDAYENME